MLLPPAVSFCKIPLSIKSFISRTAESLEHLAIFAHFEEVSFPSNPSINKSKLIVAYAALNTLIIRCTIFQYCDTKKGNKEKHPIHPQQNIIMFVQVQDNRYKMFTTFEYEQKIFFYL